MYVYRIIFPDGKSYVGSTNNFRKRKTSHLSKARNENGNKLYRAIRYFGEENLKWEVLMHNVSEKEIEMWEGVFVSFYDSYRNGYNATKLGQGSSPKKVINFTKGIFYSSIREAARVEGEDTKTIQTSIRKQSVTAKCNLYLLEKDYKCLNDKTRIKFEETIRYKKEKGLKSLWPDHKREIEARVQNRVEHSI